MLRKRSLSWLGLRAARWPAAILFGLALAPAACGSHESAGSGTGSNPGGAAFSPVRYADCMRSHGVPRFPDSSPGGGITLTPAINPSSPAFRSAAASCAPLLPTPLRHRHPTATQRRLAVAFSKCVRVHGFPQFPDPTPLVADVVVSPGKGLVRGGLYWPLSPGTIQSAGFAGAAQACGLNLEAGRTAAP